MLSFALLVMLTSAKFWLFYSVYCKTCTRFVFGRGFALHPAVGACSTPPRPLAGLRGTLLLNGGEGRGDGLDLPLLLSSFHSYTFHLAMTQYFIPNLTVRWHTTNIISVGSATFGRLTSMTYTQYIMQHKNYQLYIVTWVANLCVCTYIYQCTLRS